MGKPVQARWAVPLPIPNSDEIAAQERPRARRKATLEASTMIRGLPSCFPRLLASASVERIGKLKYEFDVSESVSLNKDGVVANVQWDFDYRDRFSTTPGYAFLRDKKTGRAELIAQYEFPEPGKRKIACSVQDDQGGEKTVVLELDVK